MTKGEWIFEPDPDLEWDLGLDTEVVFESTHPRGWFQTFFQKMFTQPWSRLRDE